ncbi:MAG: prephenate dehydrogenase/arogenate dehydrogenase family protein [Chloroflexi bacterium]|nr:prephenate dehydrogenase/arogenate dehydrogenase family protein [Chloroflexota bacterium]
MTKGNQEQKRITIVGLGLIGGSLGLAIKAAGQPGMEIVGHDRNRVVANKARKMGAIDRAEHNLPRAVQGAGMVVIATPVLAIREVMEQIAPDLPEGCVVTDTGSTKERILEWAAELLPPSVSFVGGHPMAGKETQGIDNAEPDLFRGRAYCLCPAVDAHEDAVRAVTGLVRLAGAEPLFLDPQEHDQYAAAVSHLPLLLSASLFTLLRASPAWNDLAPMASSSFRDVTRLASGDPQMAHDIFLTNRDAAVHWLDRMIEEMGRYRDLLEGDTEELLETFAQAQMDRDSFLAEPHPRRLQGEEPAEVRKELFNSLVGGWIADRTKKVRELPGLMRETRTSRAKRTAEDIRHDLEKLEAKRQKKDRG